MVIRNGDLEQKAEYLNLALMPLIESHLRDLKDGAAGDKGLGKDVALVVARYLGSRTVTIGMVARELGLSSRSLQRHLAQEGISFRELVKAQRRRVAEPFWGEGGAAVSLQSL